MLFVIETVFGIRSRILSCYFFSDCKAIRKYLSVRTCTKQTQVNWFALQINWLVSICYKFRLKGISEQIIIHILSGMYTLFSNQRVKNHPSMEALNINNTKQKWELKKFNFFDICLNFILFFSTITSKIIVILTTYIPFTIILSSLNILPHFSFSSITSNRKNQLNEMHIGSNNHRDIFMQRSCQKCKKKG